MGQKVNPVGFRLGVNKGWKSVWYADKATYSNLLESDLEARKFIKKNLKNAGVHDIKIKRSMNRIRIEVTVARPGVVIGRGGAGIEELKKKLNDLLKTNVDLQILEIKRPETSARIIAQNVAEQLERRVVPKYVASREIENARNSGEVNGVRIWVSGRIKGVEIARTEKFQWGTVPLQTLRADIDYYYLTAQVPNAGKQGIKVWVFKGDK
ncbi:30S ribosomal protein S3 [Candidatus Dojkabacteria bacterium]|nr:30S ribosomal protein S3 [Candidatus Dojkabacteria bacterium]